LDRFWLPQYPPGVAADIDAGQLGSLKALIEKSCEQFADRVAYISMGTSMTFRDLEQRSRAFGAWLQHRAGLKTGDRVAIMLPNLLQYPIAMFGALRAGFVVVNTNPLYTVSELKHQLADSGATAVLVLENFAATLAQALPGTSVCAPSSSPRSASS
jgi:long-chain acyl-CoA synthetase